MQKYQKNIQQIGGIAAGMNVAVTVTTLIVAIGFIGPAALADPNILMDLAIRNPVPLIVQDVLKLVSAGIGVILILALHNRLRNDYPRLMRAATVFGLLSVLCLLINAGLSLYSVSHAASFMEEKIELGKQLNGLINLLGMAVIAINGLWYLLVSWAALKTGGLPRRLSYLGLTMGGLSLLPPLGILVLVLGIPWSVGLGKMLLKKDLL
jgi:hypothetical protein